MNLSLDVGVSAGAGLGQGRDLDTPEFARLTRRLFFRLCNDNPFYVLSALLVLVGLWTSFGAQVKAEQTWALMTGLAAYTLLLAAPACLLVRFGGAWEDMRTVLLLVVLMFLATSVTFDEALARNPDSGIACYVAGLTLAIGVSEGMLRGMRLRLPLGYRGPYYLLLALFFLYPLALIPLLDRPRGEALEWALFGFATAAGLICLTLIPAIRRGPDYVRDNGSPWGWPLYPWALFVFLGFGVAARSFLLCWSMQHVARTDPERFIFGPYFLAPFLMAVALLVIEIGLVTRSRAVAAWGLLLPAGVVALTMVGHRTDPLYREFLERFSARLGGTPLYLALAAAQGFYLYAAWRRVPYAIGAFTMGLLALVVVGPATLGPRDLATPRPWPLLAAAAVQLGLGLRRRDAWRCLLGAGGLAVAVLLGPDTLPRGPLAFHLALLAILAVGAAFDDPFGRFLRNAGTTLALLACLAATTAGIRRDPSLPAWLPTAYVPAIVALVLGYGTWLRERFPQVAAGIGMALWLAMISERGYVAVREQIPGLDMIAMGLVLLVVAYGISLAKAGLLPRLPVPAKGDGRDLLGRSINAPPEGGA